MRIYMSCDAEGVGGVADWEHCGRGNLDYKMGRLLMTKEVNAAVEGALAAGAKEVVVSDSHEKMINLLPEELHQQAFLVQGTHKPMSMVTALDDSFDAACFIGYHARAGTQGGILSHTYTSILIDVIINGKHVGEPELNGYLAGWYGVPLVFLSGDEAAAREIKSFNSKIVTVATKTGLARRASMARHPEKTRNLIRKGVERAIKQHKDIKPLKARKPTRLEMHFWMVEMADLVEILPGVERIGSRAVQFKNKDFSAVYGMFLSMMRIAGTART